MTCMDKLYHLELEVKALTWCGRPDDSKCGVTVRVRVQDNAEQTVCEIPAATQSCKADGTATAVIKVNACKTFTFIMPGNCPKPVLLAVRLCRVTNGETSASGQLYVMPSVSCGRSVTASDEQTVSMTECRDGRTVALLTVRARVWNDGPVEPKPPCCLPKQKPACCPPEPKPTCCPPEPKPACCPPEPKPACCPPEPKPACCSSEPKPPCCPPKPPCCPSKPRCCPPEPKPACCSPELKPPCCPPKSPCCPPKPPCCPSKPQCCAREPKPSCCLREPKPSSCPMKSPCCPPKPPCCPREPKPSCCRRTCRRSCCCQRTIVVQPPTQHFDDDYLFKMFPHQHY